MHPLGVAALMTLPIGASLTGAPAGTFGDPLGGLSPDELQRFSDGRAASERIEGAADALGPLLKGPSGAACHNVGATGGGSAFVETRFGTTTNGTFDPLVQFGGSLIQTDGIGPQGGCDFVG